MGGLDSTGLRVGRRGVGPWDVEDLTGVSDGVGGEVRSPEVTDTTVGVIALPIRSYLINFTCLNGYFPPSRIC